MTLVFGWCLAGDNHHYNDGTPGECPGVSASGSKCGCPCHEDPDWQPKPPDKRIRTPRVVEEISDMGEPNTDPVVDELDVAREPTETDES